uniref:peptidylprolyl isomerase n=1 Tax=Gasterosteus aculeatus aculeatus TaxID=481459 RepID=A0AAQ4PBQ6_GASAC
MNYGALNLSIGLYSCLSFLCATGARGQSGGGEGVTSRSQYPTAELDAEIKVEVLFRPEQCTPKSKRGDMINVHYDGFLAKDGSQFYCSRSDKNGHAQWYVLGIGQVIEGLDKGMVDMCPGEKRKITVPPGLAFGSAGKEL